MAGLYGYSFYKLIRSHQTIKYKIALSRHMSRITGYACSMKLPKHLRPLVYGAFGKIYGINFNEMKLKDLKDFETFNKFFTRELEENAREIQSLSDSTSLCSPCDGRVLTVGSLNKVNNTIECVKGRSYRLDEFMFGEREQEEKVSRVNRMVEAIKQKGTKLYYMVIYLAPSDYHRFHCPTSF